MGQCEYGKGEKKVEYYDFDKKQLIPYECPFNALPYKKRCEFHDIVYAQINPDAVMKLFYNLVDEAMQKAVPLLCIGFYLPGNVNLVKEFKDRVYFSHATFTKGAHFSGATFKEAHFFRATFTKANFSRATFNEKADFSRSDFIDEVKFDKSRFPSPKPKKDFKYNTISITFDYSTFRKRMQFIGDAEKKQPLELGLVSFKGVDLSNVEFHNVRWLKPRNSFFSRYMIIDEALLGKNKNINYEEVSKIYNQLRKNYESKLLFNEASNFFVGEMEALRKSLWNGTTIREKMASIPYSIYKGLALYGESYFLPLIIWTPVTILTFIFLRHYFGVCSVPHPHSPCNIMDQAVDSFASYFQFPRSATNTLDTVERILSEKEIEGQKDFATSCESADYGNLPKMND
jgi:hypothetical protein